MFSLLFQGNGAAFPPFFWGNGAPNSCFPPFPRERSHQQFLSLVFPRKRSRFPPFFHEKGAPAPLRARRAKPDPLIASPGSCIMQERPRAAPAPSCFIYQFLSYLSTPLLFINPLFI